MSKKKGFTGSTTMKLKDFHGGSIPSDHPLPSAPGASCWAPVRGGGASGTISVGRSDHLRPRPASTVGPLGGGGVASSTRSLDERPQTFLSHIGLHFDEDKRKPFDASSVPRRSPVLDASARAPLTAAPAARSEPKQRPISSPVTYPTLGGASAAAPNSWGASKDVVSEPLAAQSKWSASRIAQASAVEKVSSGLWQSKPTLEVAEQEDEMLRSVQSPASYGEPKETFYSDNEKRVQERGRFMSYQETSERNSAGLYNEGARSVSNEGRFTGHKMQEQGVEVPDRPKLEILPRMKPMETPDTQLQFSDGKQFHQPHVSLVHVQNAHEV